MRKQENRESIGKQRKTWGKRENIGKQDKTGGIIGKQERTQENRGEKHGKT